MILNGFDSHQPLQRSNTPSSPDGVLLLWFSDVEENFDGAIQTRL